MANLELPNRSSVVPAHHRQPLLSMRARRIVKLVLIYTLLIGLSIPFLLPFGWMIATSLKKSEDVFTYPPSFFPNSFEWRNYISGWTVLPFNTFLKNSLIVTIAAVCSSSRARRAPGKNACGPNGRNDVVRAR